MKFFRNLFRGETGNPGPPGPQGIQGPPGQARSPMAQEYQRRAEAWQHRAEHYRSRMEYFRDRVNKAIRVFRKMQEERDFLQRQCNNVAQERDVARQERDAACERAKTWYNEVDRLKGVVDRLQKVAEKQQREINQLEFSKEYFENETKKLRAATPAQERYAAQNELELLRLIRTSQGQAITKLRLARDYANQCFNEACAERDAASKRANCWREDYNRVEQERDAARKQAREYFERLVTIERVRPTVIYANPTEAMKNPRLEAILEESYRNEFKRNIDNQKATDGANCPSS
jgi:chromosome segregation ATPase